MACICPRAQQRSPAVETRRADRLVLAERFDRLATARKPRQQRTPPFRTSPLPPDT